MPKEAVSCTCFARWLGDADFAKGLHAYFEKHHVQQYNGRDLWDALGQASGRDVSAFMDSWLEQPGYPVLTVKVENDVLKISQKQFFIGEHEDKNRLWVVPLNSNWKGLPDTLETEASKSLATQPFLLKMMELFVSTLKIQLTTLQTIKETC